MSRHIAKKVADEQKIPFITEENLMLVELMLKTSQIAPPEHPSEDELDEEPLPAMYDTYAKSMCPVIKVPVKATKPKTSVIKKRSMRSIIR